MLAFLMFLPELNVPIRLTGVSRRRRADSKYFEEALRLTINSSLSSLPLTHHSSCTAHTHSLSFSTTSFSGVSHNPSEGRSSDRVLHNARNDGLDGGFSWFPCGTHTVTHARSPTHTTHSLSHQLTQLTQSVTNTTHSLGHFVTQSPRSLPTHAHSHLLTNSLLLTHSLRFLTPCLITAT